MIGRFTEVYDIGEIRGHLLQGRIVFAFTGTSFLVLYYNMCDEEGIIRSFDILNNMHEKSMRQNLIKFIAGIKTALEDEKYHYLLYYGDLNINDSIYDYMKEFYNPTEELPIVVSTAIVDDENIRCVVSYCGNLNNDVSVDIDNFNSSLMETYGNIDSNDRLGTSFTAFSIWLCKVGKEFKLVFRSSYFEFIEKDHKLRKEKNALVKLIDQEIKKLGIA
jgi:hypothetical protein